MKNPFRIPHFALKMNYLDIIVAIVLFLFALKGWRKGIIIEVVTLLAFGVGIYGAMHFSDFTAEHLQEFVEIDPKYLNTVAFVLTFILLVVIVNLIGRMLSKAIHAMNLGFFNKLGGFLFGAAKGILLCSVMLTVLINLNWARFVKEEAREESKLYPYVEKTVPYLYQGFGLVKDFVREHLPEGKDSPDEPASSNDEGKPNTLIA